MKLFAGVWVDADDATLGAARRLVADLDAHFPGLTAAVDDGPSEDAWQVTDLDQLRAWLEQRSDLPDDTVYDGVWAVSLPVVAAETIACGDHRYDDAPRNGVLVTLYEECTKH